MQSRISSVIAAYNGETPHTWMVNAGYSDEIISPDTKALVANQNDLKNNCRNFLLFLSAILPAGLESSSLISLFVLIN